MVRRVWSLLWSAAMRTLLAPRGTPLRFDGPPVHGGGAHGYQIGRELARRLAG